MNPPEIVECLTAVLEYDRLSATLNREPPDSITAVLDFDTLPATFGSNRLDATFSDYRLQARMGCS